LGAALTAFGLLNAAAVAGGAWFGRIAAPRLGFLVVLGRQKPPESSGSSLSYRFQRKKR
jgi:hypothetical protein